MLLLQLGINGLNSGIIYCFVAVGFSLIFGTTRVFHVAQGATFVIAEYVYWWLVESVKTGVPVAVVITLIVAGLFGVGSYICLYVPMRIRGRNSFFVMFVASLGLLTFVQNGLAAIFSPNGQFLNSTIVYDHRIAGLEIAPITYIGVGTSIVVFGLVFILMRRSRVGVGIRATASDADLMDNVGEGRRRYDILAFAIGSMIVVPAAILNIYSNGATTTDGLAVVLVAFTSTIVGGVGSLPGAGICALLVGIVESLAIWKIPSAWSQSVVFIVLLVFLMIRPSGIMKASRST